MSWKPEVKVDGQFCQNNLAFATKEEGELSARALMMRWFSVTDSRAVESEQEVTHIIVDGICMNINDYKKENNVNL